MAIFFNARTTVSSSVERRIVSSAPPDGVWIRTHGERTPGPSPLQSPGNELRLSGRQTPEDAGGCQGMWLGRAAAVNGSGEATCFACASREQSLPGPGR